MELVERPKTTSSTDASSIDKNSTSVHPSGPQQKLLMVLPLRVLFSTSFSLAKLYGAFTCFVILFTDQGDEISLHHPSRCYEYSRLRHRTFLAIVRKFCIAEVCASPLASAKPARTNFSVTQNFHHLL